MKNSASPSISMEALSRASIITTELEAQNETQPARHRTGALFPTHASRDIHGEWNEWKPGQRYSSALPGATECARPAGLLYPQLQSRRASAGRCSAKPRASQK